MVNEYNGLNRVSFKGIKAFKKVRLIEIRIEIFTIYLNVNILNIRYINASRRQLKVNLYQGKLSSEKIPA